MELQMQEIIDELKLDLKNRDYEYEQLRKQVADLEKSNKFLKDKVTSEKRSA